MKHLVLLLASALFLGLKPASLPPLPQCSGCAGSAGGGGSSGGGCGGTLTITATVANGKCKWIGSDSGWITYCRAISGCKSSVTRTWDGLAPNTPLDFCVYTGLLNCLVEPPTAGPTGSGSDTRDSITLPCSQGSFWWTIGAACGDSATATGSCSICEGL